MATMRAHLLSGVLGCTLLLPMHAWGQVESVITIDPGQVLSATVSAVDAVDSMNDIVSLLSATAASSLVSDDANAIVEDIVGGPSVSITAGMGGNEIFGVARGNTDASFIGLLPDAPADGAVAGAGIFQGLVTRESTIFATTLDNGVSLSVEAGLPVVVIADVDGNEIHADGIYNGSVGSIETLPSASLRDPDGPASYTDDGTAMVELEGSLSVAATQINSTFLAAPDQPQVPGLPAATALSAGNTIALSIAGTGDSFLGGSADLTENSIRARAVGNTHDGSILLRNEILTADGLQPGPGFFDGTAIVYSLQNSDDIQDADEDSLGQGIVALAQENTIAGSVVSGSTGQESAPQDSQLLSVVGNEIEALTSVNEASSEIGFDPTLALIGTDTLLDQGAGDASVLLQERLGLRDALADYVVAARQSINRRNAIDPVAYALVIDSAISGMLSTPAAVASITVGSNVVEAIVAGNRHDSLLDNRLDADFEDRPAIVDATMAALNWQWVTAPEIAASVSGAGEVITALASLQAPDGDQSGVLDLVGNSVLARADGNRATSEIAFAAVDLAIQLSTDGPAGVVGNAGASLISDRGATNDGDTFGATAGGVIVSYQIVDSAADDHAESDYLVDGVRAEIVEAGIVGTLELDGPRDAEDRTTLALDATGNSIVARAQGNGFVGQMAYRADALFSGSLGVLGVQIDNDQSVSASISDSIIAFGLDATALDGSPFAASLSVNANSQIAVAGANTSAHSLSVQATELAAAGQNSLYDDADSSTSLGGLIEGYEFNAFRVTRHTSFANAAFAILNDQTVDEGDSRAMLQGGGILVEVSADPTVRLTNVALDATGNTLAAQARLNDTTNRITLDIATLAAFDSEVTPGPLAGIVSFQGSGHGDPDNPDDFDLGLRLSVIEAIIEDSALEVFIPALLHGSVDVAGNLLAATAAADVASNRIDISAVSIDAGMEESGYVAILDNANGTDFNLEVLGSVFIANSQRNEWQLFGGGPGPAVVAYQGGDAGIKITSSGEFDQGIATIANNAVLAEARATVAQNVINMAAVTVEASGQIVNRQSNTGDTTATVENAPIMLELNAGPGFDASEASVINFSGNSIETLALGNAALNTISVTAEGQFLNVDGEAPIVNEELPATSGETSIETDYAILNRQVNAGTEERPLEVTSTVSDSQMVVNLNGNHDATSVNMSNNGTAAGAYGNIATNSVSLQAGGGSMPGSSIVNQQNNSYANITASVTGSGVSLNMNGVGPGATVNSSNNGVSATAVGNSATNTMVSRSGAPGPAN